MTRCLPILAMQFPAPEDPSAGGSFEPVLRSYLHLFPATRLVVYPELYLCPLGFGSAEEQALPLDGPRMEWLRGLAHELGVWLVPGTVYERGSDGAVYNTAVAISPSGDLVATYRKCCPWRPYETVTPGQEFTVFEIPEIGRIGLSICYDTWFPEVARQLAWMGAEVIVQPNFTRTADRAQELVLLRAAAIANQVFVVNVNTAAPTAVGQSLIAGPEGEIICLAGESTTPITQVLDLNQVAKVREFGTVGLNRVWSQFHESDLPLPLPAYSGRIDPHDWQPRNDAAHAARASFGNNGGPRPRLL
ncbi:MAG: carbon-nitrogen hydrolase family protein [Acidimicrobiales bacterium]|jgi:predicted amidohydrolase